MRFVLMMHVPRGQTEYLHTTWEPDRWRAHMDYWHRMNAELKESGEYVAVEALTAPSEARLVRAGSAGMPAVTDGPFPETKEFLAGYWILDVESLERACEIAAHASAAPGPDGAPLLMAIEVRQVMRSPRADI
jgi:hypothetical protein